MIQFKPDSGNMTGLLANIAAFPGEEFRLNFPESIGDASQVSTAADIVPTWTRGASGAWICIGTRAGELSYRLTLTPEFDAVNVHIQLTNASTRTWAHSLAFNCFNCGGASSLADHECVRHWARCNQETTRLTAMPRKYSTRPTVQAYAVEGAPPVSAIPFANAFQATPVGVLEGWLAIRSRDGTRLAAVASKPALFLFQNMEYSCIHSAPSFGALSPGQTGEALTRIYLVEASLGDWYTRMRREFAP